MLKILRLYIVSILFLQLIGCTGVLYKQDQNDFRSGRKSIIIMQQYTQLQYGKQYPIYSRLYGKMSKLEKCLILGAPVV
jgi:hypothetical protein